MGDTGVVAPEEISLQEFEDALDKYPSIIKSISTEAGKCGISTVDGLNMPQLAYPTLAADAVDSQIRTGDARGA